MSFAQGYVLQEAQEMMTLSAIAYAQEDSNNYTTIQQAIEQQLAASPLLAGNYTLVWLGISPDWGNLMYLARDGRQPARYAVVVRGTDWNFLSDLVDDFDVLNTNPWPTASPPSPNAYVAAGAWTGLQALQAMKSDVFNMTSPPITTPMALVDLFGSEALLSEYDTDVDVFVTGHSLGGAMATVYGLWLSDTTSKWVLRSGKVNLKTYTFASPTVGNQDFVSYYDGQAANTQVGWQAYRVFNAQDNIPFAYANVPGIINSGIPLDFKMALEVEAAAATVQVELDNNGVSYVQVGSASGGTARSLDNVPPSTSYPPPCASSVTSWTDFACWVGYEHDHNLYLTLLGAPTIPIAQAAVDTASLAATPLRAPKVAAAGAAQPA